MDTIAADAAKQATAKAVLPMRCEFCDHGYDAGFEFFVFNVDKPIRIYAANINVNAVQDAKALEKELTIARKLIALKGHSLEPWTPPSRCRIRELNHAYDDRASRRLSVQVELLRGHRLDTQRHAPSVTLTTYAERVTD